MNNLKEILILNTGGTFCKVYNELTGLLEVQSNNNSIESILKISKIYNIKVKGLIYKDSLDITNKDRKKLLDCIKNKYYKKIIIIHGTDTINITAKYLAKNLKQMQIVLTGAMKPFSIEPIEATSNLMSAFGFLQSCNTNNIYISMHGQVKQYKKLKKNKSQGIFE